MADSEWEAFRQAQQTHVSALLGYTVNQVQVKYLYELEELDKESKLTAMANVLSKMHFIYNANIEKELLNKAEDELEHLGYNFRCTGFAFGKTLFEGKVDVLGIARLARRLLSPKEAKHIRWAMVVGVHFAILGELGSMSLVNTAKSRRKLQNLIETFSAAVKAELRTISEKYDKMYKDEVGNYTPSKEEIVDYVKRKDIKFDRLGKITQSKVGRNYRYAFSC